MSANLDVNASLGSGKRDNKSEKPSRRSSRRKEADRPDEQADVVDNTADDSNARHSSRRKEAHRPVDDDDNVADDSNTRRSSRRKEASHPINDDDDVADDSNTRRSSRRKEAGRPVEEDDAADNIPARRSSRRGRREADRSYDNDNGDDDDGNDNEADNSYKNKPKKTSFAPTSNDQTSNTPISRVTTFKEIVEEQPRGRLPTGDSQVPLNRQRSFDDASIMMENAPLPELDEVGQRKLSEVRNAIEEFVKMDGQHTTTLHETIAPPVTQEVHIKTRHELITDAVDRERHQIHYHTSVQPVYDSQDLGQEHIHRVADVEHSEVDHGDDEADRLRLVQDAEKYKDTSTTADTKYLRTENARVVSEHTHHHVYEVIRPVINRELRHLRVVHVTRPSREIIRHKAQHHSIKTLPSMSISDFRKVSGETLNQGEKEWVVDGAPSTEHFGPSFLRDNSKKLGGLGGAAGGANTLENSRASSRSSSFSSSQTSYSDQSGNGPSRGGRVAEARDKFERRNRKPISGR